MKSRPSAAIYRGTTRNLRLLARRLQAGELVAVPTETVYGLAADAANVRACRKIFRAKGRPANDPLIVHIHHWDQLEQVAETNAAARTLARAFWPGPLTFVLPKRPGISAVISSGLPSVAVRMPAHPLFRRLLRQTGRPLAAPSANPFGYISPTTAAHVRDSLGRKISHILDGGPCRVGVESTIVDLRNPRRPRVLRLGQITAQQLSKALGCRVLAPARARRRLTSAPAAPGQLSRHYSPRTPVQLHERISRADLAAGDPHAAWLYLRRPPGPRRAGVYWLDPQGRLPAAARKLFAQLRTLDQSGYRVIHAELAPERGLGAAINDRLRRAASRG